MSVFFTSDNHFYHSNIIKYCNRPFYSVGEMNDVMIEKWNKKVSNKDQIYILGDFTFEKEENKVERLINQLNGQKFLIKGNHDYFTRNKQLSSKFGWIKDYYVLKHEGYLLILFHYPIFNWDGKFHDSIHLYGHVHNNEAKDSYIHNLGLAYNVGVDMNKFEPVSFEEILKKLR